MKLKTGLLVCATVLALCVGTSMKAHAASNVHVQINGVKMNFQNEQPVVNKDGRAMVPVRDVAEALGYKVTWNAASQGITITKGKSYVTLQNGSKNIVVNGKKQTMDTAPYLQKNSTMVPVRFVVEGLGVKMNWNQASLTVNIIDPSVNYKPTPVKPNGKTIILDPGHGGKDVGAVGIGGIQEQLYNYNYAISAKASLEKKGYKVIMTRGATSSCKVYVNKNDDLRCRINLAVTHKAALFISVHANASTLSSAKGTETHYNARNDFDGHQNAYPAQSAKLANIVQAHTVKALGTTNRGTVNNNLYVNRMAKVPSVLIELGFVSNASDSAILKSNAKKAAFGNELANAVDEYFK